MRKVMYIFAAGDFPPGSGSLQVTTLQCGRSPWGASDAGKPVPYSNSGQVQCVLLLQVFSQPLEWGQWG